MTELVPRGFDPRPVSKQTAKTLRQMEQDSIVRQAALEEAAAVQRANIEVQEQLAAHQTDRRIENGYKLASRTAGHAAQLNREITQVTRDNPGLEAALRTLEDTTLIGAQRLIYGYLTR